MRPGDVATVAMVLSAIVLIVRSDIGRDMQGAYQHGNSKPQEATAKTVGSSRDSISEFEDPFDRAPRELLPRGIKPPRWQDPVQGLELPAALG